MVSNEKKTKRRLWRSMRRSYAVFEFCDERATEIGRRTVKKGENLGIYGSLTTFWPKG